MSLTIGFDIDGTLYNWTAAVNQAVMREFGCADPGPHETWDHLKGFLGNDDRWLWVWSKEAAPSVFGADGFLYDGCQQVVNDLCREHDVHFCTHRNPSKTGAVTAKWLAEHFDGYKGVHVLDNSVEKHQVMNWDVFIDDKAETLDAFRAQAPRTHLLKPDRQWNESHNHATTDTFTHWDQVPPLLDAI